MEISRRGSEGAAPRAESAERALRTLIDASPLPIVSLDLNGNVTGWNPAAERTFGWSEAEVLGKPSPTIPLDERSASDEVLGDVLQGNTVTGLRRRRQRKDGSPVYLSISSAPRTDSEGRIVGTIVLAEDVSEKVRIEEERERLLNAERSARAAAEQGVRRFEFLAEAGTILASSLDYETTLAAVSRLAVPHMADWCSVLIVERDGGVKQLATAHVDPAKVQLAEDLAREYPFDPHGETGAPRVLRTGVSELIREIPDVLLEMVAPDARLLGILRELGLTSSMTVPMIARGRTIGVITFVSAESGHLFGNDDLTLAEDLAARAALAVDNARLYREVVEVAAQKDEFLAAAAHDLKNPLAIMKTLAQLLARRLERGDSVDAVGVVDGLGRIDAAATRMTGLINELLDLARLQMDRPLDLDRRPADLLPVLAAAIEEQQLATERHVIAFESQTSCLPGDWDVPRLERVFSNVLSNAVKYSPEGGDVTVSVRREEPDGARALIAVRDRGIGIPTQDLPHVFERFYRASNAAGTIAGTGIGLFAVRQVVEQHGGAVSIQSVEGKGTMIELTLPLLSSAECSAGVQERYNHDR